MSKKDIVMESTFKLLLKKGLTDVSNNDIIEESKVGSGTIYHHFEDKDDLIVSTFNKYIHMMLWGRLDIVKNFKGDTYSTLEVLFRQIIGCDDAQRPYYVLEDSEDYSYKQAILLICEAIQKYDSLRIQYNEFNDAFIDFIAELIERGKRNSEIRDDITTEEACNIIQVVFNGILFMYMIQEDFDLDYAIEFNLNNFREYTKK